MLSWGIAGGEGSGFTEDDTESELQGEDSQSCNYCICSIQQSRLGSWLTGLFHKSLQWLESILVVMVGEGAWLPDVLVRPGHGGHCMCHGLDLLSWLDGVSNLVTPSIVRMITSIMRYDFPVNCSST